LEVTIDRAALPKNSFVYHAGTCPEHRDPFVTTGGRVLAVNGLGETLEIAAKTAYSAVACVNFQGMTYRQDIAHRSAHITSHEKEQQHVNHKMLSHGHPGL
jgi:phosphoribosylamine-glycine ligase